VDAREIECAVLGNEEPRPSAGEVVPRHEFYSYEAKYLDPQGAELRLPAELPAAVRDEVMRLAVAAFRAVEASGMARVDFFVEKSSGRIWINEINTLRASPTSACTRRCARRAACPTRACWTACSSWPWSGTAAAPGCCSPASSAGTAAARALRGRFPGPARGGAEHRVQAQVRGVAAGGHLAPQRLGHGPHVVRARPQQIPM